MVKIPAWYASPWTQVALVGFTCFCTTGMFNAVSNLGAGGISNVSLSDTANAVLYACFAVLGLVAGGICNVFGPRLTLFIGTFGYALYIASLWSYQNDGNGGFVIGAGAILGCTAALLWSAQGEIMMSYPLEKDKGKAFGVFWAIFSFGTFVGDIIALAINLKQGGLHAVATSTYVAFFVVMVIGIASAWLILPPNKVVRGDGTLVKLQAKSNWRDEAFGTIRLFKDWRMLALLPMFFASNYFYAYQGAVNAAMFDGPTRAVNATLEGAGGIIGALIIGFIFDTKGIGRRNRGYLGLAIVTALIIAIWACALSWQVDFNRAIATADGKAGIFINYKDSDYAPKGTLFFFYYFGDACYQALAYWIMSALTNDPFKLARFAGFYKAIQSAGSAGSFGMDAVLTPYLNELLASWIMMLVSFPCAFFVIRTIKETNYEDEKMIYVDDVNDIDVEAARAQLEESPAEEKSSVDAKSGVPELTA